MTLAPASSLDQAVSSSQPVVYDVAIVGAGIVGATLAWALKESGLQVVLIDAQPQAIAASRRQAYALTLLSGKIFQGLGLWAEIEPQITTFRQIRLSDCDRSIVQFYPQDLGKDPNQALGYVGEHHIILSTLHKHLNTASNIHWLCPADVTQVHYHPETVEIEVNLKNAPPTPQRLTARLLVAADGSKSTIRTQAGIATKGWKYWQSCVAFTVKAEKSHQNIAHERFWYTGPMGVLPLPGNRCQIVWTAPHSEANALKDLDEQKFLDLLQQRTGGLLGRLELVSPRYVFPVQLMQSNRYIQPRLALVGDAAHCCHPVGGQGLNMGIRDVAALAQVITQAHQQGQDIGTLDTLKPYETWRKRENLAILGFTDFLDRTFSTSWFIVLTLRRFGLWLLRTVPVTRYLALRLMTGLLGRTPKLAQE